MVLCEDYVVPFNLTNRYNFHSTVFLYIKECDTMFCKFHAITENTHDILTSAPCKWRETNHSTVLAAVLFQSL